jgi:hypothetical protein
MPKWLPRLRKGMPAALQQTSHSAEKLIATFLRLDVPLLLNAGRDGPLVLYTDVDVLFLRDFNLDADFQLKGTLPRTFVVGTEFSMARGLMISDAAYAGVMLLNVEAMRGSHAEFVGFTFSHTALSNGVVFGDYGAADQGACNMYYENRFQVVANASFDWKPYWPRSKTAALLHFGGPKPADYRHFLDGEAASHPALQKVLSRCNAECADWVAEYEHFARHKVTETAITVPHLWETVISSCRIVWHIHIPKTGGSSIKPLLHNSDEYVDIGAHYYMEHGRLLNWSSFDVAVRGHRRRAVVSTETGIDDLISLGYPFFNETCFFSAMRNPF